MLTSLYITGDINSDNRMRFDEFYGVLGQMSVSITPTQAMKLFKHGSKDTHREYLTLEMFIDIALATSLLKKRPEHRRVELPPDHVLAKPRLHADDGLFLLLEYVWEVINSMVFDLAMGTDVSHYRMKRHILTMH